MKEFDCDMSKEDNFLNILLRFLSGLFAMGTSHYEQSFGDIEIQGSLSKGILNFIERNKNCFISKFDSKIGLMEEERKSKIISAPSIINKKREIKKEKPKGYETRALLLEMASKGELKSF